MRTARHSYRLLKRSEAYQSGYQALYTYYGGREEEAEYNGHDDQARQDE